MRVLDRLEQKFGILDIEMLALGGDVFAAQHGLVDIDELFGDLVAFLM